jgi:hypothetical protein
MPNKDLGREKEFNPQEWTDEERRERLKYDLARLGVAGAIGLLRAGARKITDKKSEGGFLENAASAARGTIRAWNQMEEKEDPSRKSMPEVFRSLREFMNNRNK